MKIKAKIVISRVNTGNIYIKIYDQLSRESVEAIVDPVNFANAVTGLYSECELVIGNPQRIGLRMELREIAFDMPDSTHDTETARAIAKAITPEGWEPPKYFSSQNSFFRRGDKYMARGTMRRWVKEDE